MGETPNMENYLAQWLLDRGFVDHVLDGVTVARALLRAFDIQFRSADV
jgi:hypothetical protein